MSALDEPLRAAVIGCGRIGCGFDDDPRRHHVSTHAGAYAEAQGVVLAALCDLDRDKVSKYAAKYGVKGYTDPSEMLEAEKPDLLSVCTREDSHLEMVRLGVEQGVKLILCEKPIADSLEAAAEMIALCRQHGVLLSINHQRRFDVMHQEAAAFIRGGGLGRIQQVRCTYGAGIRNTGTHLIDGLRLLVGEAVAVRAEMGLNPSGNPHDPNLDGYVELEGGVRAWLQSCDVKHYYLFETEILGTRGRLCLTSSGLDLKYEEVASSKLFPEYGELRQADPPFPVGDHRLMPQVMAHLVGCLREGREPVSTGEDGLRALEVILALLESARRGGERMGLRGAKGAGVTTQGHLPS